MMHSSCLQFKSALRRVWSGCGGVGGRQLIRTFTSDSPKPYIVPEGPAGRNRAARLELAAAYRGLDQLGLNESVNNHLSLKAPRAHGEGEVMLVFPWGIHWNEVTASNLVGVDMDNNTVEGEGAPETTASTIHLSIHKIRKDAKVIMHTHQPYTTALTCREDMELQMVHQNSGRFYKQIAYDKHYGGVAFGFEEGERIASVLGDKDILLMANHGVLVTAPTVAMAFQRLYFIERAAMVQILATSPGHKLTKVSEAVLDQFVPLYNQIASNHADTHFYAIYRQLQKTQPDFQS